ncbi:MAG: glycosyltransferase [Acidimicrobiia bacterium]
MTILPGRDDLRSVYAAVDLVLVPSREESLSLVALEAAAQGTPVVYFPGSGGPDHLAREGITIRPAASDADSVAATVADVLAQGPEKASIRTSTKESVRKLHGAEAALPVLRNVVREELHAAGARIGVGEDTPTT